MEEKEELLPCPFCGAPARLVDENQEYYDIKCTNQQCAAILPEFSTPWWAIDAWNTRAK